MEDCWRLCKPWITWVWQGRVKRVIATLDQFIAQTIDPATLETLTDSRGYLHNNPPHQIPENTPFSGSLTQFFSADHFSPELKDYLTWVIYRPT